MSQFSNIRQVGAAQVPHTGDVQSTPAMKDFTTYYES